MKTYLIKQKYLREGGDWHFGDPVDYLTGHQAFMFDVSVVTH